MSLTASNPWLLDAADFPVDGEEREQALFLVRYAILAPSSHNSQPWRFAVDDASIRVYLDESRWLRIADADQRELHISAGCAVENLMVAAEYFGFAPEVEYFPDEPHPGAAASIHLAPRAAGTRPADLIEAITRRHTNRRVFDTRPLPAPVRDRLAAQCRENGIQLSLTDNAEIKHEVERLASRADAVQFADPAFREELGEWIGSGAFGAPWLIAKLGQLAVTHLNMGEAMGKKDTARIESAPVLGLITSSGDDRTSQLKAGRVLESIYLAATLEGVSLQPESQLCEVPEIRAELSRLAAQPGLYPQQPFRLGYAPRGPEHTPRRPLEDVVVRGI